MDESPALLKRDWLVGRPNSADELTVLQWNCLADWARNSFPRVDPEHLTWEYRKPRIVAEIRRADPDIVCLQEVDRFEELNALLKPQFDGYFKSKGINTDTPSRDGAAIFWKRDRLVARGHVDLHYSTLCGMADMKQVMLSALFEFERGQGEPAAIQVVTTHLKAKKGFDQQRLLQCEAMAKFLNEERTLADLTIVCGDFNTGPDSAAVAKLLQETSSVRLKSTYRSLFNDVEPDWTTWKIRDEVKRATIDFMFSDTSSRWQPVDVWNIPEVGEVDASVALPCSRYPSDHLALATKFAMK